MRQLILVFLMLMITCCNRKECLIDLTAKKDFEYQLNIVSSFQKGKATYVEDYRYALLYLSFTTGLYTKADYSSTIGYETRSDFKKDMKGWHDWYKKNKCRFNQKYIDSVLKQYRNSMPQIEKVNRAAIK